MDINSYFVAQFSADFVRDRRESCRNSWATYRYGTGSPSVAIIRRFAALIRRGAAAIESWANGPAEAPRNFRQPNVPAR